MIDIRLKSVPVGVGWAGLLMGQSLSLSQSLGVRNWGGGGWSNVTDYRLNTLYRGMRDIDCKLILDFKIFL